MATSKLLRPGWMFLMAASVFAAYVGSQVGLSYYRTRRDAERVRRIVASEELILSLGDELEQLTRSILNLQLPDPLARELFAARVDVADLRVAGAPSAAADAPLRHVSLRESSSALASRQWVAGASAAQPREQLNLWQPLLHEVDYFEHAKFYMIRGQFDDASLDAFTSHVGFKGLARMRDGNWAAIEAKQTVRWQQAVPAADRDTNAAQAWQIVGWTLDELHTRQSPKMMFAEVLDQALPDPATLQRARHSEHEAAVTEYYRTGGTQLPWSYFTPISANQRPSVSVVDIDRDGFDDLYVVERRGRNQLFRNRGDGTFAEVARQWGLDIEHFCSCAIFADFDNDGDPDLMLGRSFQRSMYLENVGGRFEPRPEASAASPLPYLVVSMSAADYNRDGLLDVYFSTYRPAVLESIITDETSAADRQQGDQRSAAAENTSGLSSVAEDTERWTQEFLAPEVAERYERLLAQSQANAGEFGKILDQIGPPNVLLVNRGQGKFEVAPESEQVALWRNTLQATWADFDEDGDPDLYVANDWATDNLLRNDGPKGFVDVTQEMGTTEFGFGMGVSWGDYDQDGLQDIYVSNMYSKAGRRITAQIKELNPDYPRSVAGNYLYRNTADGFKLVSGLDPPALLVAEAGWSWGGEFADFDNDGWLDLYVLSGYFTAPPAFASNLDL
jgi:hypothetical protein